MTEHARGFYKIVSSANLRWLRRSDGAYPEISALDVDDLVFAVGGSPTRAESYFDGKGPRTLGWRTDHTWVLALSTLDDDGDVKQGWIDNSCMSPVHDEVTTAFEEGDVLYGRSEAREPWVRRVGLEGMGDFPSLVGAFDYNIIDDLNNAVLRGLKEEAVEEFAAFLENAMGGQASAVPIRKMCKCGLTYITHTCNQTVHFVLDGLDARRVMAEAGVHTKQGLTTSGFGPKKYCTGAEMRRLMRQRFHDEGKDYGRNYHIKLGNVKFYLAMGRVPAPWERGAPQNWSLAWQEYRQFRQSKPRRLNI